MAAKKFGIDRRKLYYWIKHGKISAARDKRANLVVAEGDLGVLESLIKERQSAPSQRKLLIQYYAETRDITEESARLRLGRKVQQLGSLEAVAKAENGFRQWLKERAKDRIKT